MREDDDPGDVLKLEKAKLTLAVTQHANNLLFRVSSVWSFVRLQITLPIAILSFLGFVL